MSSDAQKLFTPFRLGDLELPNRIVMAPLTRSRATHGTDAPNAMIAEYYRQRATAGLIVSEATQISKQGQGYAFTPGVYSPAQIEGWTSVTKAVHEAKGHIFAQLWHVGRFSHTSLQPNGGKPVAPSAIKAPGKTFTEDGAYVDVSEPRALELSELPGIVADYVAAAKNAVRAGFDGVEIHAANGYLLDQFLKDGTNKRTDAYGGSVENRARLALEVIDAVLGALPKGKVGIRISPISPANGAEDSDPQTVFGYLVDQLSRRGVGYIHVVEGATGGPRDNRPFDFVALRKAFKGAYMANNGYTRDLATETLAQDKADLIAFGVPFIANPDLVERLRRDVAWNKGNKATWYGGGAEGYTDYSTYDQAQAAE